MAPRQGELWLYEPPENKARPALVVGRDTAARARVLIAPVTSTVRGLPSELPVDESHGLDHPSVASFDNLHTARKAHLTRRLGTLGVDARHRICSALAATADC